ncbi:hemerythrin domain-containing protein [Devosia sp. WQ 349]|uniref:hemerythrin domain-containing protein n=1 Tax=Devosia sp. WQ 349K1 TaxID=2800329 RepID=UPI0019086E4E|nr:hemerythrin domain-containing protein [Devosia sp. WQ 349K1]MBK1794469.1 hemerythrin domain-containing protein [Devosia sp. WQ 349K1]
MLLKDIQFLDDATRPPVPVIEGVTPDQREAGNHLRDIHDYLRQHLSTLGQLIERASAGEVAASEVRDAVDSLPITANYKRFGNVCGQYCHLIHKHHTIEDQALFPALATRSPALKAVVERLEAEHVTVHHLLELMITKIMSLSDEPTRAHFDDAVEVFRAFEKLLLSHFKYEEDSIIDALGYYGIL